MNYKELCKLLKAKSTIYKKQCALEAKIKTKNKNGKSLDKLVRLYKEQLRYDSLLSDPGTLQLSLEGSRAMYHLGLYYGFGKVDIYDVRVKEDGTLQTPLKTIDKAAALKYLQTVFDSESILLFKGWAGYAWTLLSLDRLEDKAGARDIFDKMKWMGFSVEEESEWSTSWGKNVGILLSLLEQSASQEFQDLQAAYYHSWWIKPVVNNPRLKAENPLTKRVMDIAKDMRYNEKTKEIGAGLSSSLLLKHAVDLYSSTDKPVRQQYVASYFASNVRLSEINEEVKNNINSLYKRKRNLNSDIAFWIERALSADPNNAQAYYFTGTLYLNGEGGLPKSRSMAKVWFADAAKLGSDEGKAALAVIEEIEYAERQQQRAKRAEERRREAERRMQRKQAWSQAIGTIVQAAGSVYMASQGYVNNVNLLNPNLAIAQVENQYAQMAVLQQVALQNIQMPQFDNRVNWSVSNSFTVDWSKVKWENAPIDTYYLYQGDLVNNGVNVSAGSQASPADSEAAPGNDRYCYLCHGTKKCWTCGGKRTFINPLTGKSIACPNCSDGWCSKCHGTGKL